MKEIVKISSENSENPALEQNRAGLGTSQRQTDKAAFRSA